MSVYFADGTVKFAGTTVYGVCRPMGDDDYLDIAVYEPETKTFKTVTVWTTAAACGPMPRFERDVPEEVAEAYWEAKEKEEDEDFARRHPKLVENGYTRDQISRLQYAYRYRSEQNTLAAIIQLLETKKFKSKFRESLRDQVRKWLNTPVGDSHVKPLSERQAMYL